MIQTKDPYNMEIVNHNFIQQLEKDIKRYDILYIYAPIGWEKESVLREFYNDRKEGSYYWLETSENKSLSEQIEELPVNKKRIIIIPRLEAAIEQKEEQYIWNLLSQKQKTDVFVFGSSLSVPEDLVPYTYLNRTIIYRTEDIRPNKEDVAAYMKSRDVSLSEEELFRIEKDSDNYPLFVKMLANLMYSTGRSYHRAIKEQCFDDVFTFLDVMFFRTFSGIDQNALLKLSCFEVLDNHLIAHMLDMKSDQVEAFLERLINKGSILEKSRNGWYIQPIMKNFLEQAMPKFLDHEERMNHYRKAMHYLIGQEKWLDALRFAYVLQDREELAYCLQYLISEKPDYGMFIALGEYFDELSIDHLLKYPKLLLAQSTLRSIAGDVEEARKYENLYIQLTDKMEPDSLRSKMKSDLLVIYMMRPGMLRNDVVELGTYLLSSIDKEIWMTNDSNFAPQFISVLRGAKDFCNYFTEGDLLAFPVLETFQNLADEARLRSISIMLKYMKAEVLYERNHLDRALNELVAATKEANIYGNERLRQLCTLGMIDLLAARNQMNSLDTYQLEKLEGDGLEPADTPDTDGAVEAPSSEAPEADGTDKAPSSEASEADGTDTAGSSVPKTGDAMPVQNLAVVMLLSAVIAVAAARKVD